MTTPHPAREPLALAALVASLRARKLSSRVCFDFCGFAPNGLHFARGTVAGLALGFSEFVYAQHPTVKQLRDALAGAVNQTFLADMVREFKATGDTTIWVANPGAFSCTAIAGVEEWGELVVLRTNFCEAP